MDLQDWIDWIRAELDDVELLGPDWRDTADVDMATADHVFAHPVYAAQGFVSVVNPGPDTTDPLEQWLRTAHAREPRSRDDRIEHRP